MPHGSNLAAFAVQRLTDRNYRALGAGAKRLVHPSASSFPSLTKQPTLILPSMSKENVLHLYLSSTYLEAFVESEPSAKLLSYEDTDASLFRHWQTRTIKEIQRFFRTSRPPQGGYTQVKLIFPDRDSLAESLRTEIRNVIREFVSQVEVDFLQDLILRLPEFQDVSSTSFLLIHTWGEGLSFRYIEYKAEGWQMAHAYQATLAGTPLSLLKQAVVKEREKQRNILLYPKLDLEDRNFTSDLEAILKAPARDIKEELSIKGRSESGEEGVNSFKVHFALTDVEFPDIFFASPEFSSAIKGILKRHQGEWPPTYVLGDFFKPELVREAFIRLIRREGSKVSRESLHLLRASSQEAFDLYRTRHQQAGQEQQAWEEALAAGDISAYQVFIDRFPQSPRALEAQRKIAAIEQQEAQQRARDQEAAVQQEWKAAAAKDTLAAYRQFARKHPQHPLVQKAEQRIKSLQAEQRSAAERLLSENGSDSHGEEIVDPLPLSSLSRYKRPILILALLIFISGSVLLAFQYLPTKKNDRPSASQGIAGTYQGEYLGRVRRLEIKATNQPDRYRYSLIPEGARHRNQSLTLDSSRGSVRLESLGEGKIYEKTGFIHLESAEDQTWHFRK